MKKILKFLIVIAIVVGIVFFATGSYRKNYRKQKDIEKIKEGWYLEVICEGPKSCDEVSIKNNKNKFDKYKNAIKVRKAPTTNAEVLGAAEKGDVFKIYDVDETDNVYLWYRVQFYTKDGQMVDGFIGENRSLEINSVKDHNGEVDISAPVVKFDEDEYHVASIDDINYDHLTLWDDRPGYEVTHTVYIEQHPTDRPGPQYWIEYTITDKVGKSSSKLQRIVFDYEPSSTQVKDFDTDYMR